MKMRAALAPVGDTEGWIAEIPEPASVSLVTISTLLPLRRKPRDR
jgi:hypothetical protein